MSKDYLKPDTGVESTPTSGRTTTTYELVCKVHGKQFADELFGDVIE
jgi:hypothetical protein